MEGQIKALLLTGRTVEQFDEGKKKGEVRSCYFCGRSHGQECVAVRDWSQEVTGNLELEKMSLGKCKDGTEMFLYICKECGFIFPFLYQMFSKATGSRRKQNNSGFQNRINFN